MQFNLTNELNEHSIKASIVTDCGDFNDQLIFNSAIQNKLGIITNDKDYFTVKMLHPDYPDIFSLQSFFHSSKNKNL